MLKITLTILLVYPSLREMTVSSVYISSTASLECLSRRLCNWNNSNIRMIYKTL